MNGASLENFRAVVGGVMRNTGGPPFLVFDKDGTLAPARRPLSADMSDAVSRILPAVKGVAVISGAEVYRLRDEVLGPLTARAIQPIENFYLIAENGAQTYRAHADGLDPVDTLDLNAIVGAEGLAKLAEVIEETRVKFGIADDPARRHVVVANAQIKLSALGNLADDEKRERFDPDATIRNAWADYVRKRLAEEGLADEQGPLVDVIVSGTSSINVLPRGVNKGSAIQRLAARHGLGSQSVIYFGDQFGPGGNDSHALSGAHAAVNFGRDVAIKGVINAAEKGPSGAKLYLETAHTTLSGEGRGCG